MKTFKELLEYLNACEDAKEWAGDKTIEQVLDICHRGDWLLWLASRIDIPIKKLTLAKVKCARTVEPLMRDERSLKTLYMAESFANGEATYDELINAADAAADAAYAAAYAAYDDAAAAAYAAYAAAYASYDAYYDAYASASAAYAAEAASGKRANLLLTANIVRETIGNLIIEKVNELLNQ
mgnify:CR=1 FL=1